MTRFDGDEDLDSEGRLREDGPTPKLVVIGIAWAGVAAVALLTALLMQSAGIAVFGVLCAVAGAGIYFGQQARKQFQREEAVLRADPREPDPTQGGDERRPADEGEPSVMTTPEGVRRDDDDIVDAEYTEQFDYVESPADQDDGTGFDEEELAYQEWRRRRIDQERVARHEARAGSDEDVDGFQPVGDPEAAFAGGGSRRADPDRSDADRADPDPDRADPDPDPDRSAPERPEGAGGPGAPSTAREGDDAVRRR